MDVYPDAKLLLSVRSAASWVEACTTRSPEIWFGDGLMHHLAMARYQIDPALRFVARPPLGHVGEGRHHGRQPGDREDMAADFERWNEDVIDTVPSDRLLVWDPKDGWEPLCDLLEVGVPDAPLPNVNDTENFHKNLIMGPALEAINAWWEENSGLEDEAAQRPAPAQGPA